MMRHRRPVPYLLALATLLCLTRPGLAETKLIQEPDPSDPMRVSVYRLDNGLLVYLTENHQQPRFRAEIAVRAGSMHDPDDCTGIAHYLEHMLSKGTDEIGTIDYEAERVHLDSIEALYERHWLAAGRPAERGAIYALIQEQSQLAARYAIPRELDMLYEELGATGRNAHTWVEETVYKVDLPANRLEHWARIESERFSSPVFRLFQTELEAVYEEKNRSLDNGDRMIREAVDRVLYKVHPYGQHPNLGTVEHLKNPSLRRMREFYQTWYVPNNMAVFISGDIDVEPTIQLIDREFSSWVPRDLPKQRSWKEKDLRARERVSILFPGQEYVLLAFRTQPSTHKDTEALQILDMILDNSMAGLINLELNQKQRLAQAGSSTTSHGATAQNDYGAQYLWGVPKQGQPLEEVERLLIEQVERLKRGDFEDWLIPAIVADFEKQYKLRFESNQARIGLMRAAFLANQDWEKARQKLARMARLRKKDIISVAEKHLGPNYVAGYRRNGQQDLPLVDKPQLDPIDVDGSRRSEFAAGILALPSDPIEPRYIIPGRDVKAKEVRDGVTLHYTANPLNDLFTFSIHVDFGVLADPAMALAPELLNISGTPILGPEELKVQWYRLGTDFAFRTGDDEATVEISGLDANFGASLSLLVDLLTQPTVTDSALAQLKEIILTRRRDAMKDRRAIHRALCSLNRYGEDSYYRRVPSSQEVQTLSREELLGPVRELLTYEHLLNYTGSLPIETVLAELAARYELPGGELAAPPPYRPIPIRHPEGTEIYFFHKEMAQAQVQIESGDEPYRETRQPSLRLYNEYFSGSKAGIVFQELREARALAYSAWAQYRPAGRKMAPNYLTAYIGCQADKTPEAVAAFLDLIDNLPVSEKRFAAAQQAQVNQFCTNRLGFRQLLGAVRMWERQDVPIDPRSWRLEQIQRADLETVLEFQRERIKGRPRLVSIVGDRARIDLAALARSGRVRELELGEIFGF